MIDDDIELENSEELDQLEYTQISKLQQNPIMQFKFYWQLQLKFMFKIRRWYSNKSWWCRKNLALLKDYYYDARYRGDNFVVVTVDELREALEIMLDVVEAVNCWRTSPKLEILIADPRGEFQSAMSRLKQKFWNYVKTYIRSIFWSFGVNSMYNAKLRWKKNLWMKE